MAHQPPGAVGLRNNLSQGEHKLPVHRRSLTEQGALLAHGLGQPSGDRPGGVAAQKPEMYQNSFGMLQRPSEANDEFDPTHGSSHIGARRQSYDVAKPRAVAGRDHDRAFVPDRHSGGQSHLSGFSVSNQSPLLEEVRKNNFGKVSKLMDQFLIGKQNSGTITGRDSQQRRRNIKNSFQTVAAQR